MVAQLSSPIGSGFSQKKGIGLVSRPSFFPTALHPAHSSRLAPLATSATVRPHCLLAALTQHCATLPAQAFSPVPWTAEDRWLLQLGVGAKDHRLSFFRDPSVASLNSMWAPSSPLFVKIRSPTYLRSSPWATTFGEFHPPTSLYSPKQQGGDVELKAHVATYDQVF